MKANVLILFLFSLSLSVFANTDPIYTKSVGNFLTVEDTKSFEFGENQSLHFVIATVKSTKDRLIMPFYVNSSQEVRQLKDIPIARDLAIINYHSNGDTFTYTTKVKGENFLMVTDINLATGEFINGDRFKIEKKTIATSRKNETVLLNIINSGDAMEVVIIKNVNDVVQRQKSIPKSFRPIFKSYIDKRKPVEIKNEVFTDHGALNKSKLYNLENSIRITHENTNEELKVLTLTLSKEPLITSSNIRIGFDDAKESNSFILNDYLFTAACSKEDIVIKREDLNNNSEAVTVSKSELSKHFNNEKEFTKLLKKASGSKYDIALGINETKQGDYLVNLSYQSPQTYNYNNMFWFHQWMQQNQMMQMQQMNQNLMNSIPRFQPSSDFYDENYPLMALSMTQEEFVFIFKKDGNVSYNTRDVDPKYPKIERKSLFNKYDETNRRTKFSSAAFHKNVANFIYLDKKDKKLKIDHIQLH